MPLLIKDDTISQTSTEISTNINLRWDRKKAIGLPREESRLYEDLREVYPPEGNLLQSLVNIPQRVYTPPFSIGPNHSYKDSDNNLAIRVDVDWTEAFGAKEDIVKLEGAVDFNGPWYEVGRIGSGSIPSSYSRKTYNQKLDVRRHNFGNGSGDGGDFAKPSNSEFDKITGYRSFSPDNWGESASSAGGGIFPLPLDLTDSDYIEFWAIVGNNSNGGKTPLSDETLIVDVRGLDDNVELAEGAQKLLKITLNSDSDTVWTNYKFKVKHLTGQHILQFRYNKPNGPERQKHRFGISNVTTYKEIEKTIKQKRKFHFTFNTDGTFNDLYGDGGLDIDSNLYVSAKLETPSTYKWYRLSVKGTTFDRNIISLIKPQTIKSPIDSPMSIDDGTAKWWVPKEIFVKDSNVWKEPKDIWVKENGSWKKVYPHFTTDTSIARNLTTFSEPEMIGDSIVEVDRYDGRSRVAKVDVDSVGTRDWKITGDNGKTLYYDGDKPKVGDILRNYIQDLPTYGNGFLEYYHDTGNLRLSYGGPSGFGVGGTYTTTRTGKIQIDRGGTRLLLDTYEWRGFFVPKQTGHFKFTVCSDDGSAIWLGRHAVHGGKDKGFGQSTDSNKVTGYLGNRRYKCNTSGNVYLTKDKYYPIWIAYYEWRDKNKFDFYVTGPDGVSRQHSSYDMTYYTIKHRGSGWR